MTVCARDDSARLQRGALCTEPTEVLTRVRRFIETDAGQGMLDYRSRMHYSRSSQVRLTQRPPSVLASEGTVLTPEDLRVLNAALGELNRGYGCE